MSMSSFFRNRVKLVSSITLIFCFVENSIQYHKCFLKLYNLSMLKNKITYPTLRRIRHIVVVWIIETFALILLDIWLPGLSIQSGETAVLAIALIGLLNAVLRPIILYLTITITVLTIGLFSFLINVVIVLITIKLIPGFVINNGQTAILVVLGVTLINLLVSEILALDENDSYHRLVISRFSQNHIGKKEQNSPGVLFIQIDGLSKTVFERALDQRTMPSLAYLYHQNAYRLEEWFCGLPSQTSSCQMGIIYGKNNDIPAFRWYEKENQKLIVSNHLNDTALIESRYGFGESLLGKNTSSIGNMFSGGAEKSAMTMSQLPTGRQISRRSGLFYNFFLNPYNFIRTFSLLFLEIFREYVQKIVQLIKNHKPRMNRSFIFAVERALAAVFLRELTTHIIIEDMFTGYQTIYATYVGYDVVAHKTGIDSSSTRSVLRSLDKQFERIINANKLTKRKYSIIFLSDHGQSQGSTFRQVYGISLEDLLKKFVADRYSIVDAGSSQEIKGYVNSLLQEALAPHRKVNQSARKIYRHLSTGKGTFTYFDLPPRNTVKATDLIICTSGNMALVYFPITQKRMSFEQLSELFPDLIANIVSHPGIGFVMVTSEEHGTMIIHSHGINYLSKDQFEGSDILPNYPAEVRSQLIKINGFEHSGDLILFSATDAETMESPAFEDLIGHHGGLGGLQTQAMVFFPNELKWEGRVYDSTQMHDVLKNWKNEIHSSEIIGTIH